MKEIEVKVLDVDREKTEEKLVSLGAEKIFDGEMEAFLFDSEGQPIRKAKNLLRLRKEGRKNVLTFKAHEENRHAKVHDEYEVEVSDLDTMKRILELLGFSTWWITRRRRTSYKLDGVRFEFDRYLDDLEYVPEFLEIEAKDVETIHKYAERLGFRKEECVPLNMRDLAEYYSKKR